MLHQNLELFDAYLAACDAAIEAHVSTLAAKAHAPAAPLPGPRTRKSPATMSRASRFAAHFTG